MRSSSIVAEIVGLIISVVSQANAAAMKLTIAKSDQDRKYAFFEKHVPSSRLTPPFKLTDEAGNLIRCQWEQSGDGHVVRWMFLHISAGTSPILILDHTDAAASQSGGIKIKELDGGSLSISDADHEITRYNVGPMAE